MSELEIDTMGKLDRTQHGNCPPQTKYESLCIIAYLCAYYTHICAFIILICLFVVNIIRVCYICIYSHNCTISFYIIALMPFLILIVHDGQKIYSYTLFKTTFLNCLLKMFSTFSLKFIIGYSYKIMQLYPFSVSRCIT